MGLDLIHKGGGVESLCVCVCMHTHKHMCIHVGIDVRHQHGLFIILTVLELTSSVGLAGQLAPGIPACPWFIRRHHQVLVLGR